MAESGIRRQKRGPEGQENEWKYPAASGGGRRWEREPLGSPRDLECKRFPGLSGGDFSLNAHP